MALRFPPIFLLPTHLQPDELHRLEEAIPSLTYDIHEAEVVLGKLSRRERAMFELRRARLETEPLSIASSEPPAKRARLSSPGSPAKTPQESRAAGDVVKVVKIAWLTDSLEKGEVLPLDDYLLYEGRKISHNAAPPSQEPRSSPIQGSNTVERALGDSDIYSATSSARSSASPRSRQAATHVPALLHQTTSEHDLVLPLIPPFLTTTYSCQRPTLVDPPNSAFIEELKRVRTLRILQGDQVGVRAYSTSIATLAAYPYPLLGPPDVARLPGCGLKMAELYEMWVRDGQSKELADAANDERLKVLGLFYEIWGVGDTTARDFYKRGWRDLDDVVEYGWQTLSRVQQIGVKYYDEFRLKIPRAEVEEIGAVILQRAKQMDEDFQTIIVGGYRRGKKESGDVDVVISHPDESMTLHLIKKLVLSLEQGNFITHTLSLSTKNSERGQTPVPWKGNTRSGSGFDTLDKALVVWKDPSRGDAPHRRVDLIVSPWRTVGCAVLGWSGGTTFQRDLRRYCKKERRLKFDSSGVRSRVDGRWVDLENANADPAPDMVKAERRVFEALGLPWRPPEERCTG
ncbi:hypothetical protein B0I35DRAFT_378815 [Stachybotrys elegans]|uniref:DNA polymerase n=1 Tax=Stachybotrys elegans TaxID=80388 RepID=A0A8K0SHB4_9HYPO|nr:hypothetical protein B0I35DRAFT_378815 [Stachybotrys elegans]